MPKEVRMTDPEREMAEKLIVAIEDNTKARREATKEHISLFILSIFVATSYFIISMIVLH